MPRPLVAALVCGSPHRNHDFDFSRLRLAQALYDAHGIRTDCYMTSPRTCPISPTIAAWDLPVFQELVKRGVEWAAQRRPF